MNIPASIPPEWSDHAWQPLVLPTRIVPARYTTRPEWSSDGESMWMRLSKFSLFNRLSLHALVVLVTVRSDEAPYAGVDLRRADRFVLTRLASLLEIAHVAALDGFCLPGGHPRSGMGGYRIALLPRVPRTGIPRGVVSVAIHRTMSRTWIPLAGWLPQMRCGHTVYARRQSGKASVVVRSLWHVMGAGDQSPRRTL